MGKFLYNDLIPTRNLADTLPPSLEEEKEPFLSFVRTMLTWFPEERTTACELTEHRIHFCNRNKTSKPSYPILLVWRANPETSLSAGHANTSTSMPY
jgi:hypothetical protein